MKSQVLRNDTGKQRPIGGAEHSLQNEELTLHSLRKKYIVGREAMHGKTCDRTSGHGRDDYPERPQGFVPMETKRDVSLM